VSNQSKTAQTTRRISDTILSSQSMAIALTTELTKKQNKLVGQAVWRASAYNGVSIQSFQWSWS